MALENAMSGVQEEKKLLQGAAHGELDRSRALYFLTCAKCHFLMGPQSAILSLFPSQSSPPAV